jgi:excisionase family DNA binding protein
MIETTEEFCNTDEICKHLNISRKLLYKLIRRQEFPCHLLGSRTFRYKKSEVAIWLDKNGKGILEDRGGISPVRH